MLLITSIGILNAGLDNSTENSFTLYVRLSLTKAPLFRFSPICSMISLSSVDDVDHPTFEGRMSEELPVEGFNKIALSGMMFISDIASTKLQDTGEREIL